MLEVIFTQMMKHIHASASFGMQRRRYR